MGISEEDDIKELFDKVSEHFAEADEGARGMFTMLVSTALRYRDALLHSTGHALTVAETREALDAFMETLKAHAIPANIDKRVHDLVVLWLEELRSKVHN
ncbi:MAG TPA: hypothetical protein PLZ86_03110 [bacterium]|nr:hypothetical protein [bacterium]